MPSWSRPPRSRPSDHGRGPGSSGAPVHRAPPWYAMPQVQESADGPADLWGRRHRLLRELRRGNLQGASPAAGHRLVFPTAPVCLHPPLWAGRGSSLVQKLWPGRDGRAALPRRAGAGPPPGTRTPNRPSAASPGGAEWSAAPRLRTGALSLHSAVPDLRHTSTTAIAVPAGEAALAEEVFADPELAGALNRPWSRPGAPPREGS